MWRHIQNVGLTNIYRNSSIHRFILKFPLVLALSPEKDVESSFQKIKEKIADDDSKSKIDEFFTYFEDTYLGSTKLVKSSNRRNARMVEQRTEPMFEIKLWNLHRRVQECIPRTNNFVEAWHNSFSNMLKSHPLVYKLVD
ncbi:unnamed protein product [Brachionus calyciflorus]|uniref:Uncharacterized protein n=1 Tax=Brachionus calyciflorus TaxID=104777 RepID=A0A814DXS6_9BILA|nr:unnamed protein product [Brachionus calyciflorus]